jgi:rhodanese-related sulfurtransferase
VSDVPEIDIEALRVRVDAGAVVVDVREHHEYHEGHVPGALHIPLATVPDRLGELPTDSDVLVVCAVGGRSARAVAHLRADGIDAVNVAGGTGAWIEAGLPVVTGGEPR